jgi:hypothetical protein
MLRNLLFLFSFVIFANSKAQTFSTPVAYNDYIVNSQNELIDLLLIFNDQVSADDAVKSDLLALTDAMTLKAKSLVTKVEAMGDYEGNWELRNSALELFRFYVKTFSTEYPEMIELIFAPELDEATLTKLNAILEKVTTEESFYDNKFAEAQQAFAKKHNIQLIENELQEEIDGY